jgi:hypothetical protein
VVIHERHNGNIRPMEPCDDPELFDFTTFAPDSVVETECPDGPPTSVAWAPPNSYFLLHVVDAPAE